MAENIRFYKRGGFDNILNYLYQYGNKNFVELPFSEVDATVLSAFSYIPFEEFLSLNDSFEEMTISEMCVSYLAWINIDYVQALFPEWLQKSVFLAMALLRNKRFSSLKVKAFSYHFSTKSQTQFAAIDVELSPDVHAVVYRGTDNTIVGWKEDFNFALYDKVYGQDLAHRFLAHQMNLYPKEKFYVMGHSKGGNLAVYASYLLGKKNLMRVLKIYNLDGPGVSKKVSEEERYQNVLPLIFKAIVKSDIFGNLLFAQVADIVIDSYPEGDFANQHDLYNWKIQNGKFLTVDRVTPESKYVTTTFNRWLEKELIDIQEKRNLIEAIFKVQAETEYSSVDKILEDPAGFVFALLKMVGTKENKEERKVLRKGLSLLMKVFLEENPNYNKDKNDYNKGKTFLDSIRKEIGKNYQIVMKKGEEK